MRSTMLLALALSQSLMPASSMAEEPPPIPEGGLNFFYEGECIDNETGQPGYCYVGYAVDHTVYLTFWQNGTLQMIRKVIDETDYETVWTRSTFAGV